MASSSSSSIFLFLLLPTMLAMASPYYRTTLQNDQCECPQPCEINLHMYLHQFLGVPTNPTPNEVPVILSSRPLGFGQMYVDDWTLTTGPDPNENIVARAHGMHIQAGQTKSSWYTSHIIVFQDDRFTGSTLQVMGILTDKNEGEWSIVGGTGEFTNAYGTIKFKMDGASTKDDSIRELDIHAFYTPDTQAAHGTASVAQPLGK